MRKPKSGQLPELGSGSEDRSLSKPREARARPRASDEHDFDDDGHRNSRRWVWTRRLSTGSTWSTAQDRFWRRECGRCRRQSLATSRETLRKSELRRVRRQDASNTTSSERRGSGDLAPDRYVTICAADLLTRVGGQDMTPLGLLYRRTAVGSRRTRTSGFDRAQVGVLGLPDAQARPGVLITQSMGDVRRPR